MKKIIMLVMCLFLIGNLNAEVRRINLQMNKSLAGHERRIPIHVPCVLIENNVLFFDNSCVCSSISVLQNGEIVYTAVVDENMLIELPDSLAGEYELQLQRGSITFAGVKEL